MKIAGYLALLLAAASLTATTTADFSVTAGKRQKVAKSSQTHANYAKQWTLGAGTTWDSINSIDLDLAGRVYVSYANNLPSGVLGYVNVTGSSKLVVDAVSVGKDALDDDDYDDDNDDWFDLDDIVDDNDRGELNVRLGKGATAPSIDGYLLTEITLASGGVRDVKSSGSAQVVIEDGVLVKKGKFAELQIEATGSSAVYVSAANTPLRVRQLNLDAAGTASIEFNVESVYVKSEAQLETQDSSSISLLSSSFKAAQLEMDAERGSRICMSAHQVETRRREIQGASRISVPNASSKYGSGTFACKETKKLPARELACVSSSCTEGYTTTNNVGVTDNTTPYLIDIDGDYDDDDDDTDDIEV